jgi:predicted acetyltransferase
MANGTSGSAAHNEDVTIRVIGEEDVPEWGKALRLGFMEPPGDGDVEFRREQFTPGRSIGAFHGARCVGTFRSTERELTVPGGASLATDAITNVSVAATHRRRGILTRMMTEDLAIAATRGDSLAILIAAEYRIYGRYGFGAATQHKGYNIDKLRAGSVRVPAEAEGGSFELLTQEEYRKIGPELHERWRLTQPGAIDRRAINWRMRTGELRSAKDDWKEPMVALYRDPAGQPAGIVAYEVIENWPNMLTKSVLKVREHYGVDHAARAALWRYVLDVDWTDQVKISNIAPDDPLPLLLDDPRACVDGGDSSADFLWLRILDAPTAFAARTYAAPGRVVLQITDALGYVDGRWALEAAEDGTGRFSRIADGRSDESADEPADLAMDVSELGTLYLGGDSASRLTAAGLVRELRAGGAARADALLRTDFRPWCLDGF